MCRNINQTRRALLCWNREEFGNIFARKRRLWARLEGVQRHLDSGKIANLLKLERKLQRDLDDVLEQEELLWFQRSREEWIASGDRNTKFYHTSTLIRKNRNKIVTLKDMNGEWVTDVDALVIMVVDFYRNLFQEEVTSRLIPPHPASPIISEDQGRMQENPVTQDEIKRALFEMAPFKSPGVDEFHARFYQHAWEVVGNTIGNFVQDFFKFGILPQGVNDTLLALIPKVPHPETLSHLRPISLYNFGYKVITKTMTNRLKEIMASVTSPNQSSFVPGRQTTDDVIIYQEILHSMR